MSRIATVSISVLFCVVLADSVNGQAIRLDFDNTPLVEALGTFRESSGVDVVFSPELAGRHRTSCRYIGSSVRVALICIVSGLPFRIHEVNHNQWVLIPLVPDQGDADRFVLNGFVYDASSLESLIGAHILLPEIGAGTVTNDAGYFAFPGLRARSTEVVISFLGFERLDTTLAPSAQPLILTLSPGTTYLSGVLIERSIERADLVITPGVVSMSPGQLADLPGAFGSNDVLEVLRWMPGIERAGEVTGGLMVRGSGPDQNLYLIDGAPIYHPWHAFSLISTFQTDTFKNISFYRGAFPAEYGGRLSAVLDAELRDGARSEPRATVEISPLNANFLIESPISQRSSFMLSGRRSYLDKIIGRNHPVTDDSGRKDTLRTGYYFYDWSAKLSYRPDSRSNLSFSYYSGADVLDLKLPFDLSLDFSSWLRPADLFFEVDQHWGNRIFSTRFQRLISDKLFLTSTAYRSTYDAAENTFIKPTQSSSVKSAYSVKLENLGLRIDLDYYPSLNHQVRSGFAVIRHRFATEINAVIAYSPTLIEPLDQSVNTETTELAVYIQDLWRPSPAWRILPGIRISHFGKGDFFRASPRLTLQYAVDPTGLVVRASATSHVQFLQRIRDRNSFLYDLVSSRWVPASSKTAPSRSGQLTFGLESRALPRTVLRADIFARGSRGVLLPRDEFKSKDGLLGPGIEITTLLGQYTQGNERSFGVELGLQTNWKNWRILSSYTGMRSQSRAQQQGEVTFKPTRFDTPRSWTLVAIREARRWKGGFSVILRSGYPLSVPVSRYALTDPISGEAIWFFHRPEINNGRLPAYFRIDANYNYRFTFGDANWSVGINLYNVMNRRNVVGRTFDPSSEIVRPRDRLGLPLLPLFNLKMEI